MLRQPWHGRQPWKGGRKYFQLQEFHISYPASTSQPSLGCVNLLAVTYIIQAQQAFAGGTRAWSSHNIKSVTSLTGLEPRSTNA